MVPPKEEGNKGRTLICTAVSLMAPARPLSRFVRYSSVAVCMYAVHHTAAVNTAVDTIYSERRPYFLARGMKMMHVTASPLSRIALAVSSWPVVTCSSFLRGLKNSDCMASLNGVSRAAAADFRHRHGP